MRKISILLIMIVVLISCQDNKMYKIIGTVADPVYEGKNVYIKDVKNGQFVSVDSAIITNGEFSFEGPADSVLACYIALDETIETQKPSRTFVILEQGKIKIEFDSTITLTGSKLVNSYSAFSKEQNKIEEELESISHRYRREEEAGTLTDSLNSAIVAEYGKISDDLHERNLNFIKANIGNSLGQRMFGTFAREFEIETQKEILALMDDKDMLREDIKDIIKGIETFENVAIGKKFVDFMMKDPAGNDVSLSDYAGKGKVVLIDFWASWCGPCCKEIPNIAAAYKIYKDKGFEVVGVSFDRNKEGWLHGLKELNMTWPQMSDLQSTDTPLIELYNIHGIPHTVLLDGDGTIIAKDIHGEELNNKLKELLGK